MKLFSLNLANQYITLNKGLKRENKKKKENKGKATAAWKRLLVYSLTARDFKIELAVLVRKLC